MALSKFRSADFGILKTTCQQYEVRIFSMLNALNRDVADGAILGALIGDAAGATLEFLGRKPDASDVERALMMVGGGVWQTAPGQITDDGEMTLALAYALAGQDAFDQERAAYQYRRWALSNPFDMGIATHKALGFGELDSQSLLKIISTNAASGNADSKANGSLMRASALGVWSAKVSLTDAIECARLDAQLTHPNLACQWSGVAYVLAIRHLVLNPGDGLGAFDAALDALAGSDAGEVREWMLDARNGDVPAFHPQAGYVRIAFTNAFFHLQNASSYKEALFKTLLKGGDTDTNACIVGGLLGALHGVTGIPDLMRKKLISCDTSLGNPRPEWLHPRNIDELITEF